MRAYTLRSWYCSIIWLTLCCRFVVHKSCLLLNGGDQTQYEYPQNICAITRMHTHFS
jgi:hypothetical protein